MLCGVSTHPAAPVVSEGLIAEVRDGVLHLVLNRPERKNSISPELRDDLLANLEWAAIEDDIRCVLLTGSGDAFCAGVDIGRFTATATPADAAPGRRGPDPRAARLAIKRGMQRVIRTIWELDKPVVAAVNGVAAGGGAQLAIACDLVLAAESARFIEIFVRRGMALDSGGAYLLARNIGLMRAKELVFFGDPLSAGEAERIGLVNRTVADADLARVAGEWAARLAHGASRAIGASKLMLNRSLDGDIAAALEDEASLQAMIALTDDYREGLRAFKDKRDPDFTGR
ncbi:MAG: 2-(1,2-epoxy,2-dihydrophenyl)acetyl-CoA isomerase [Pseudonocardiales bacterium]|nr:2-(1,2-epoxy,2-dihydrophenyl)acetyl-CoA isomerase [Pseudonocardiales bacterium]